MSTERVIKPRELKFRVWNGSEMVSPDYITRDGWTHWKENSIPTMSRNLMQFTGLHDKNGKEIYDGDILKDHSGYTWVVFWHSDHACFGCRSDISTSEIIDNSNMEVIGHIYESKPVEK